MFERAEESWFLPHSTQDFAFDRVGDTHYRTACNEFNIREFIPSLELGIDKPRQGIDNAGGGFARIYGNHIAWRDSHTPVPSERHINVLVKHHIVFTGNWFTRQID